MQGCTHLTSLSFLLHTSLGALWKGPYLDLILQTYYRAFLNTRVDLPEMHLLPFAPTTVSSTLITQRHRNSWPAPVSHCFFTSDFIFLFHQEPKNVVKPDLEVRN